MSEEEILSDEDNSNILKLIYNLSINDHISHKINNQEYKRYNNEISDKNADNIYSKEDDEEKY